MSSQSLEPVSSIPPSQAISRPSDPSQISSAESNREARRDVLENVDILQQIFENFAIDEEHNSNNNSNRQSLLMAALSGRSFLGPAMDEVWKTMSSLMPFLKLLPSFKEVNGVKMIYGSITPEDWTRFGDYARRTRNFIFSDLPPVDEVPVDQTTFIRLARRSADPLFPSLRRISYPCQQLQTTDPFLLLSSSVERIDLAEISPDNHKVLALLSMLSSETPGLKSLNIAGTAAITTLFLQPIMQLQHLCSLSFTKLGPIIDNEVLQWIGRLERLTRLSIDFHNSLIQNPTFVGFDKLTFLCITAKPLLVNRALEQIGSTLLEDLSIATLGSPGFRAHRQANQILQQWASFATVAKSRWHGSLRKFLIKHERPIPETIHFFNVFSPLLDIHTLEDFEVKQLGSNMQVAVSEYQQMTSAWRKFRLLHLHVILDRSEPIPNVFDILKHFSQNCRNMTSLELFINIWDTPASVTPEFTSFHKLETISFGDIQVENILAFATSLDCLFPNLKKVGSILGATSGYSVEVDKTIKVFQTVRSYERARMIALWK